jgi:serine/threonine protein kinase
VIGKLLNQYRLEEVVGQGGMGVVYRALDMNLQRTVAVKLLSASCRDDPGFIGRFREEARIQAGLNHPNIATLFDFFLWNDMPVAVMEFIRGETLRSMIEHTGPVPAHIALPIFIQALRGVAAGHKRGIIHRDLKPGNLMITDEGTVKITDFGIAKVRSNTGFGGESTRVGSAQYMAPEQILGRPVDERTDIYIMGGTLYELLTGRPPFRGVSQFEIDSAHVRDRPKPPTAFCPNIPPALVDAVMCALAKEPSERFASADEFLRALPDLHGVPYIAPPIIDDDATRPQHSGPGATNTAHVRRPLPTAAISGLVVLSTVSILLYLHKPGRPSLAVTAAPPGLTGMWTGTYVDGSGRALLQLLNLQIEQVANGLITGRFTYKAGITAGQECTLDKSSYSTRSKRLRLITHCRNPDHPKYLNVPLEFADVEPGATTIEGGRLAFHLADDIVVTLKHAKGI